MTRALALLMSIALLVLAACGGASNGGSAAAAQPSQTAAHATPATTVGTTTGGTETGAPTAAPQSSAAATAGQTAGATQAPATKAPTAPPAATTAAPAGPTTTIGVSLLDNAIKLSSPSAPAGTVVFQITNNGTDKHELEVLQTSLPQDQIPAATAYTVQTPGLLGSALNIPVKGTATLTLQLGAGPYVLICNLPLHYKDGMHVGFTVTAGSGMLPRNAPVSMTSLAAAASAAASSGTVVNATLTEMAIALDRTSVPAGVVTFLVTNAGAVKHELVVEQTDIAEDKLPAGDEPGKASEQWWVGETGDIDADGHFSGAQLTLAPGRYVIICNEPGHYAAGMHIAFTVTEAGARTSGQSHSTVTATLTEMAIALDHSSVAAGTVTFLVTNAGAVKHELVVLQTDLPQDQIPPDPDEEGKVSEAAWAGETGDIDAGHFGAVQLDLPSGNYVLICNLPGHYAAGMHVAFTVR